MTPTPAAPAARPRRRRVRYLDGDKLLKYRLEAELRPAELAARDRDKSLKADLTQGELAARVRELDPKAGRNLSQSLISMWERGRQGTSMANVRLLARALERQPEDLMPGDLLARIGPAEPHAALAAQAP